MSGVDPGASATGGSEPESSGTFRSSPAAAERRYPFPAGRTVRRAREWYLYDDGGRRYIDFWQADGAAFLGHRPAGYAKRAKAEIDRGLWTALPTAWDGRYRKALAAVAAAATGRGTTTKNWSGATPTVLVLNGATATPASPDVPRWFPTAGTVSPDTAVFGVVLPAPGVTAPFDDDLHERSAIAISLLTAAAWALVTYLDSDACRDRLGTATDLPVPPGYRRDGVWLFPAETSETDVAGGWERVVQYALSQGVIVPPDPWTPFIVPGGLSRIDRRNWERVCNEWPL